MTTKSNKVTDRIKTIADAQKATGRPKVDFSFLPENIREYFEAQYDALVIAEALNEGWVPDWDNNSERKWYPWFIMSPAAFAFDASSYGISHADAGSGSRLKFKSEELSDYAAKQFPDVWRKIQIG